MANEGKHTPGPWRDIECVNKVCTGRSIIGPANELICLQVADEDARLIAAAPALLAALRDVVALEKKRATGMLSREEYERRMTAARAAIAQVEGSK